MADEKFIKIINMADQLNDKEYKPDLSYYHRSLALLSILPHNKTDKTYYQKTNNQFSILVNSNPNYGMAYGTYPRLIFLFMYSYSHNHKTDLIPLGNSVYKFLNKLNIEPSKHAYSMIRKQALSLFNSTITFSEKTIDSDINNNFVVSEQNKLFWKKHNENTLDLFNSYVRISRGLFQEFQSAPIPINMDIIKTIKNSSLQMDLLFFFNYRNFILNNSKQQYVFITNQQLVNQFGSNYKRMSDFKRKLRQNVYVIQALWNGLNVEITKDGMYLYKSPLLVD